MADFAAVIELSALDGTDGFEIQASSYSAFGRPVSSAGDVNGDGYDDFIIGAYRDATNGFLAGGAVVVFGGPGGFPANFSIANLDGSNGFRIFGATGYDFAGTGVSSAGDINGDGFDDLLIGAPGADPNGHSQAGAAYVVFGKASGFAASIDLASLNGSNGFKLSGVATGDLAGARVASAGDINHDGIDDIIIGALNADPNGNGQAGSAYVVFGTKGGFSANLNLSSLNGSNGFRLDGSGANFYAGKSVAGLGDVNGDGIDDIMIGATGSNTGGSGGASYVVFGRAGGFAPIVNLGSLNGSDGFRIFGPAGSNTGYAVSSAGDVNGDGIDDMLISAFSASPGGRSYAGAAYVVFGSASGFGASLDVSMLNGTNGFRISGEGTFDFFGASAASAGDLNSDGFDDVIVGASNQSPHGGGSGASYVIFGKASGFAADVNVATLDGTNGFKINGEASPDSAFLVGGGGDFNHDGADDLIIGAPRNSDGGSSYGAVYIIYGKPAGPVVIVRSGDGGDNSLTGGVLGDTLSGGGGKDVLNGLAGDDTLNGDAGNDTLYGGDGVDTVHGGADNDIVNGDAGDDQLYGDDGNDKVNGGTGADHLYGGAGADQLDGGDGVDVLDGGEGNDTLTGGAGADAMSGGAGNDVYYVDDLGDTTVELSGEGTDIVRASLSWVLGANVEQLELQGSGNIDGTGNELANRLAGNSGANVLSGAAGVDTIDGGGGNDRIIGGTGNDLMTGGSGADTFVVLGESVYSSKAQAGKALEIDFVYDLNKAEGDRLDLSAIDANANLAGDQAFTLVSAFTKTAGQMTLVYTASANQTVLSLDTDGDGKADYQMKITGDVHLDSGGWLL